jgi:RNA polymerase sigma factor (sigma-70 family)
MHSPHRTPASYRHDELLVLVEHAQHGDDACHAELQRIFAPLLARAIAPYHYPPTLHEDLAGEVIVTFHHLVMEFDPDRGVQLTTYLARTLPPAIHTVVRRARRAAQREIPLSALPVATWGIPQDEEAALLEWLSAGSSGWESVEECALRKLAVERLLAGLTPRRRAVLLLRLQGHGFDAIAAQLGITPAAASKAYQRALRGLDTGD